MPNFFLKPCWKFNGWTFDGASPYHLKKAVFTVGSHTSWKGLIVGLAAKSVLQFHQIQFLGEKKYFKSR